MLVLHALPETLQLFQHAFGRPQPLFIKIKLNRIIIEFAGFLISSQGNQRLHGHGLPVRKRVDQGSVCAKLFHLEIILVFPQTFG